MYRNILITEKHRKYQPILWRDKPSVPLKCIELQTVTYGTSCAPYLAVRTLSHLAALESDTYPLASRCITLNCYIGDILVGSNDIDELINIKKQLIGLLNSAGFSLHKWSTNEISVLYDIPENEVELGSVNVAANDNIIKTLGLYWNPNSDVFKIAAPVNKINNITKRQILSFVSRIFDPLGLIGPVVTLFKVFMQKLWSAKLDWDARLPTELEDSRVKLQNNINLISEIQIPRWTFKQLNPTKIELHGFADASQICYGCVIYIRSVYRDRSVSVNILCSKSRVAPLRKITLPRLELCGIVLLARLTNRVLSFLPYNIDNVYLWSDSTIALNWVCSEPSRWNTFVSNRVSEIQELRPTVQWGHVSSELNPCDPLSRGVQVKYMIGYDLWFNGPIWLHNPETVYIEFKYKVTTENSLEMKKTTLLNVQNNLANITILNRFSNFNKLIRTNAYCLRFVQNCRCPIRKVAGHLSLEEIEMAKRALSNKSKLQSLTPFLDENGIIRVGGRIQNAHIPYEQKHPIVLPAKTHFTDLLVESVHKKLLHGGPQSVLAYLRLEYWTLGGRREVKRILSKCIVCFRYRATGLQQVMSPLPQTRVRSSRAFLHVGVDFAGPVLIKQSRIRKALQTKAYIALFICMATKAVHIKLVSDLSTNNFILALKRFTSRRGLPGSIYSDNGTNFKGAHSKLNQLYDTIFSNVSKPKILIFFNDHKIRWNFIPPLASHHGGLWQSNVKSIKTHLVRTVGNSALTYEEMYTVLAKIEAILNSRPLTPLTENPSDLSYLTPGHFLINALLTALAEVTINEIPKNKLNFWKTCSFLQQSFWKTWSIEYLHQLQQRAKWRTLAKNVKVNSVVLIIDKNLPPQAWLLGRVVKIHRGNDNNIRAVDILTQHGVYTRPIVKIAPLPFECNGTSV